MNHRHRRQDNKTGVIGVCFATKVNKRRGWFGTRIYRYSMAIQFSRNWVTAKNEARVLKLYKRLTT